MSFQLVTQFTPKGDQPKAINDLVQGLNDGSNFQVLLGATGTGKTFTIANVIHKTNRPTLILSHNKTLAAQLYNEFKHFFPDNAVEYFISYYDYYQPEAYIAATNTYIEKDLSINKEIEKLRLSATSSLLSGRRDVIVVASVSCIYGIGNPDEFGKNMISLSVGQRIPQSKLLYSLVDILYSRSMSEFEHGNFRVNGDTVDVFLAYADYGYRIVLWGDEIESLTIINPLTGMTISHENMVNIFPANLFVTSKETQNNAIHQIQDDLVDRIKYFSEHQMNLEATRLKERTELDLEMIRELGFCSGIENYSRYFDKRSPGQRPFCLLDYFSDDFLTVIDESHVTIPQIHAMSGGDRSRKKNLVENGFRLPSALDNRPLKYDEFHSLAKNVICISATPSDYELSQSEGVIIEQIIRPTGLLDPEIDVRPSKNQMDDIINELELRVQNDERVLITTITKKMAEELSVYLANKGVRSNYIHSEVKALERVEILHDLRIGEFDVLVGVNLLREGLDLPEVSLVIILDADKEGFLRNTKSMIQTIGRAARNVNGRVIMYADKITQSMQRAIDETQRRRNIQAEYNIKNNIIPTTVIKNSTKISLGKEVKSKANDYDNSSPISIAADPLISYMSKPQVDKLIKETKRKMKLAAKELDFVQAAIFRDEIYKLEKKKEEKV